jgi:hypothetical protein
MLFNHLVPCYARVLVPLFLAMVLALFFLGHLLLALAVEINIVVLGYDFSLKDFQEINVINGVEAALEGKAYFLAITIIIVSVIWPYVRTLAMIFLWCIPPTWIPLHRRGCLLQWLDFLAKWSMFDIYSLMLFMLALNINIVSPTRFSILPAELYDIELRLSPQIGLYCNLLAQILSQIVSHVEMYYHRKTAKSVHQLSNSEQADLENLGVVDAKTASMSEDTEAVSVCFRTPLLSCENWCGFVPLISRIVVLTPLIFAAALIVLGAFLPAITVTTSGIVGVVMDVGNVGSRTSTFTFYQLAQDLVSYNTPDALMKFGIWSLAVVFIACTVLAPLVQAVLWMTLWSCPLKRSSLKRLRRLSEALAGWSFFEVFLIAVFITVMQVEMLAFGISIALKLELGEENYKMITGMLDLIKDIGIVSPSDGTLLSLVAVLRSGAYVHLLAAICLGCTGIFINSRVDAILQNHCKNASKFSVEAKTQAPSACVNLSMSVVPQSPAKQLPTLLGGDVHSDIDRKSAKQGKEIVQSALPSKMTHVEESTKMDL